MRDVVGAGPGEAVLDEVAAVFFAAPSELAASSSSSSQC